MSDVVADSAVGTASQEGMRVFELKYQTPYRFDLLLSFFKSRAMAGVERVEGDSYLRTVRLLDKDGCELTGWIRVYDNVSHSCLSVSISESLLPVQSQVLEHVRKQFDVDCDPQVVFEGLCGLDEVVKGANVAGTRLPGCFDPFETACRAILGQQITVAAANKLAGRVVEAFGTPIKTGVSGLSHIFPTPQEVAVVEDIEAAFGQLGVIVSRTRTIQSVACALVDGKLDFGPDTDAQEQIDKLLDIKGIGPWSANYIAMRCLSYPDAFMETDAGVKHALPQYEPKQRLALAEQWRPWRSYANICLWNSLAP